MEGNVEQDIAGGWVSAAPSGPRDDAANLLVTWPEEPEIGRHPSDAPVRLSDGRGRVVEALGSCDEARVDPRCEPEHVTKGAPVRRTRDARHETKETK